MAGFQVSTYGRFWVSPEAWRESPGILTKNGWSGLGTTLLRVLTEYSRHYHHERNHQGKGNRLLFPDVAAKPHPSNHSIHCRQRLGGRPVHAVPALQQPVLRDSSNDALVINNSNYQ